jgi:hypothetical protein
MQRSISFKAGVWVRFIHNHIEDSGISFRAGGETLQVVGNDTQFLLRLRNSNGYTTCARPGEVELCK